MIKSRLKNFLRLHKVELIIFMGNFLMTILIVYNRFHTLYIEYPDAALYLSYGKNFLEGNGFYGTNVSKSMVVPIGITLYLFIIQFLFRSIIPAIILQYIMHSMISVLLYKLTYSICNNKLFSLISSAIFLFCKDIILFSPIALLTETSTMFLFLLILYLLSKRTFNKHIVLIMSVLITVIGLIRPHFFMLYLPYLFYAFLIYKKRYKNSFLKMIIISFSIPIIILTANTAFNYFNYGAPILLANYTAKPFYLANNPNTKNDIEYSSSASNNYAEDFFKDLDIDNPEIVDYNEKQNLLKTKAVEYIIQNPIQTIKNMTNKFLNMFLKPYKNLVILSVIGLILLLFNKEALKKNLFLLSSLLFTYFTYAIITSSGLFVQRYAIYALPIYFILACSGIGSLISQIKSRLT